MKVLLAEYAVATGNQEFMLEGKAMLSTLVRSFVSCGHEVVYPSAGTELGVGKVVKTSDFKKTFIELSKECEAYLVIAPDEILGDLTEMGNDNSINLGCPPDVVRLCADKLACTLALNEAKIPVPETIGRGYYQGDFVVKPRFGCASEGIFRSKTGKLKRGFIATRFINGEHLSVSLICGETLLPLTINRQLIETGNGFSYKGGTVPYYCERSDEIMAIARETAKILGCEGYVGIDIVLADKPYVVDVNPRPTSSIIGISKVLDTEIADLISKSKFGELPEYVKTNGTFAFKKDDLILF